MKISEVLGFIVTTLSILITETDGSTGPTYGLACHQDADCSAMGMHCFKDYVGCSVGVCGCKYGSRQDGSCVNRIDENSCSCRADDQCPRGLECIEGECTCTGRMIGDNAYCLKPYELLLGTPCGSGQTCLQRKEDSNEFVSTDTGCAGTVCKCRKGLLEEGWSCRRYRPGEFGCYTNVDCSGDSICNSNRVCACPAGHKVVASGKCGRNDAVTNIPEGRTCDELLRKDRFCGEGLECVKCGDNSQFKCRKYRPSRPSSTTCSGNTLTNQPRMPQIVKCLLIIVCLYFL